MATFTYSSNQMRDALFAECQKDFSRLKEKVLQDARAQMTEGLQKIVAQYSLEMSQQETAMDRSLHIAIRIIEPAGMEGK